MSRRTLTAVIAAVTAGYLLVVIAPEPDPRSGVPDWVTALADPAERGNTAPPRRDSPSTAPLEQPIGRGPATFAFPAAARWDVRLGAAGAVATATNAPAKAPVQITSGVDWAAGETLHLEVLDQPTARRVGARGFVFTVSDEPRVRGVGGRLAPGLLGRAGVKGGLDTTLTVDYGDFANAFGAGYGDRLRVVALPACALADPVPAGCRATDTPLAVTNDTKAKTLVVTAPDLAALAAGDASTPAAPADFATAVDGGPSIAVDGGQSMVAMAVTSGTGGDPGEFAASPLSIAGSWQVAPGSGEFSYTYPMAIPSPGAGSAPTVSLNYSSGSVDGLTKATNTQAGANGLGWSDFANAFIERSYEPCVHMAPPTTDLCWKSDNATISLAGVSGALVPINADHSEWVVQNDPGWRVRRLQGATNTNIHQKQYWLVTGLDGTKYYFGFGQMPGSHTNSILAVDVFADDATDPCRGAGNTIGACQQGWRWHLDRIEDPDGNVTSMVYVKEANWYSPLMGFGTPQTNNRGTSRYDRAALLGSVYYGGRGSDSASYSGRVTFGREWRCGYLVAACPAATASNGGSFFDVPNDLICAQNAPCTVHAPTFFTGKRYAHVRTEVKVGTAWKGVAQYNIVHWYPSGAHGEAIKMQLDRVGQAAIALGELNAYPATTFTYRHLNNRADHDRQVSKAMRHNRLETITNPFGGSTKVTYGQNRPCAPEYTTSRWDENVRDCFPQTVVENGFANTSVFNKYLVMKIEEDPDDGFPTMTTEYAYENDPAWAFDTGAFARDEDEIGWSQWRGYGATTITNGASKTRIRVHRGLHGDPILELDQNGNLVPLGRRDVRTPYLDGSAGPTEDFPGLAGRTLEEAQYGTLNETSGTIVQARRQLYQYDATDVAGYAFDLERVAPTTTTERVYSAPGAYRERRSQTAYNDDLQPISTLEEGWLDVAGDERCSTTSYAANAGLHMLNYPAVNQKLAGSCDSTDVLSRTETYYDGGALGAAPTRGNPTRQRTKIDDTHFAETTTTFDTLGRPTRATDPNGAATETAYTPAAGGQASHIPIQTTVTNALGHQVVTHYQPEFNAPTQITDANGNTTTYSYDEFGRVIAVWLPTEPIAFAAPSYWFSYDIENRSVRSQRLVSDDRGGANVAYEDAWVIYDGFWRERQAQGLSPVAGKALVSETTYNDRGLVRDQTVEQALTGAPGAYIAGNHGWLNRTRHSYDELGREIQSQWWRGTAPEKTTTTEYGVDTVTVTGPDGRAARQRLDGLGRTVATEEKDGNVWVSGSFGYDLADRLTSITDPEGNTTTYTYDLAGRRTSQQDPNRGAAIYGHDAAGNLTVSYDVLGNHVVTAYDALSRPIERRVGSPTGPLLASWTYDTAPGGKGKLAREVSVTPSGDWVTEVVGYDIKGRPTATSTTVPAGLPGLSGTYTVGQTYDRADRTRTMTLPAIGGLPAETISTDYNSLGLPVMMAGLETYVGNRTFDDRGRTVSTAFGPAVDGATWLATSLSYNTDQKVSGSQTYVSGSSAPDGIVAEHLLTFDATGNLKEKTGRENSLAWRECYTYDDRSRLVAAGTVASTATCAAGQPGTGDRAYEHSYQYSPAGKLLTRAEDGVTTSYAYPAAGAALALAPTQIGSDTFQWNAKGQLTSRTVAGGAESLDWDVQGRLQSVTATAGSTQFGYDAAGQRVTRTAPNGRVTVYVAGHELSANADGSGVAVVRPYTFAGQLVATRTLSGVDYLVTDGAGSVEMAIPSGGQPNATRTYLPYGSGRFTTGTTGTERGFLGQLEDASTKLSYLNARYYDTEAGIFTSPDAVLSLTNLKSLNPFSYSNNNPTTYADPSGNYSSYTFGLEVSNTILRDQNKALMAHIGRLNSHIGRLNSHIADLQGVIKKQQRWITDLLTHIDALNAELARRASIIRQLEHKVRQLKNMVAARDRLISHLKSKITYYKGVIGQLVNFSFLPDFQAGVLADIYAGRGITSWEGTRLHRALFVNKYLLIGPYIHLEPMEIVSIIGTSIRNGASEEKTEEMLYFMSFMKTTTLIEQDRLEAQEETSQILADHYSAMTELYEDFVEESICLVGGQVPGYGTAMDAACTLR